MAASARLVVGSDSTLSALVETITFTTSATETGAHIMATWDNTGAASISTVVAVPSGPTFSVLATILDSVNNQNTAHIVTSDLTPSTTYTVTITLSALSTARSCAGNIIADTSGYLGSPNHHAEQVQATPTLTADAVTSGNSGTISQAGALISAHSFNSAGITAPTAGTGFTSLGGSIQLGSGTNFATSESKHLSVTTAVAATFTATSNNGHATLMAIFGDIIAGNTFAPMPYQQTVVISD